MATVAAVSEPITLLFVDDEVAILAAITRVLRGSPFVVLTANDPQSAIAVLRQRPVDVLVSDVDMPGMTGLELVALARREFPTTMRMLLTGAATEERVVRAINEGEVARFFVKPFDAKTFGDSISALAGRIERERRERREGAAKQRQDALIRWASERFAGLLTIETEGAGVVAVDVERLESAKRSLNIE